MKFVEHYLVLALIFVIIDSLWIAVVANKFYKRELSGLLAKKPKLGYGALFYVIYIWSVVYFVLDPGINAGDIGFVIKHAALLGLAMYATYDLTNLSTLKNWSRKLTVVDMIWGTLLTTAVSSIGFAIFH